MAALYQGIHLPCHSQGFLWLLHQGEAVCLGLDHNQLLNQNVSSTSPLSFCKAICLLMFIRMKPGSEINFSFKGQYLFMDHFLFYFVNAFFMITLLNVSALSFIY